MVIVRTNKEFSKETMPLAFLRTALSIGGLHSCPLKFTEENFIVEETWHGVCSTGSKSPWDEEDSLKGYTKERSITYIKHNTGFDSECYIINKTGKLCGYYKESHNQQYAPDSVAWCNLLLQYGFLEIVN